MYRNTYLEIDENILKNNIKEIRRKYNGYKYYFGVVKANCYGHGVYCVKALKEGGVNYFATSSLEEAIDVRKYDKNTPILCLEPIPAKYIDVVLKNKVTVTISSVNLALEYSRLNIKEKLNVHIKLDTGMSRLGVKTKQELEDVVELLESNENIFIEGVFTHFATNGIYDIYYDKQVNKLKELLSYLDLNKIPIIHLGGSLMLVNHEKMDFVNGIRLGIVMYGINLSMRKRTGFKAYLSEIKRNYFLRKNNISDSIRYNDLKVRTAMKLYSEVIEIKRLKKGDVVGYGATFKADKDMLIGIVPIGYADGITNSMGYVSIGCEKYPMVGTICMDMTFIAISDKVKLHDKVEFFGDNISVSEVLKHTKSNAYHLFTDITTRVPRVYQDLTEIKY